MLTAKVGGDKRTYTTGEEFVVPALPLDRFLESVFSLAQAGKANAEGLPNILRMAVIQQ